MLEHRQTTIESTKSSRIPAALQEVFLASNRGEEVNVAPANGVAFRLFRRVRNTIEKTRTLSRQSENVDNIHTEGRDPTNTRFSLPRFYKKPTLSRPSTTSFGDLHVQTPKEHSPNGRGVVAQSAIRVLTLRRVRNDKGAENDVKSSLLSPGRQNRFLQFGKNGSGDKSSRLPGTILTNQSRASNRCESSDLGIPKLIVKSKMYDKDENCSPHSPSSVTTTYEPLDADMITSKIDVYIPEDMSVSSLAPHEYIKNILGRRGYPTKPYDTRNSGYHNDATPLQEASFTTYIVALVRDGKTKQLRKMLEYLHPNPSNYYGESLIHLVCRLGSYEMLKVMLECGSSVQVCDDYGRTPLHDACWSNEPSFDLVSLLIQEDCHLLFMADCRGSTPLQYITKQNWEVWRKYIDKMVDEVFPVRPRSKSFFKKIEDDSSLARMRPNSRPLKCPSNELDMQLVRILATGRMTADEIDVVRGSHRGGILNNYDCSDSDDEDSDDTGSEVGDGTVVSSDLYFDSSEKRDDDELDEDEDDGDGDEDEDYSEDDSDISDSDSDSDLEEETESIPANFRNCSDSVGTGSWRDDEMYMDEDDFEEMLQRIAMSKRKAKEQGDSNLKNYYSTTMTLQKEQDCSY